MKYKKDDIVLSTNRGFMFCPCILKIQCSSDGIYETQIVDTERVHYKPGHMFHGTVHGHWHFLEHEIVKKLA